MRARSTPCSSNAFPVSCEVIVEVGSLTIDACEFGCTGADEEPGVRRFECASGSSESLCISNVFRRNATFRRTAMSESISTATSQWGMKARQIRAPNLQGRSTKLPSLPIHLIVSLPWSCVCKDQTARTQPSTEVGRIEPSARGTIIIPVPGQGRGTSVRLDLARVFSACRNETRTEFWAEGLFWTAVPIIQRVCTLISSDEF